MKWKKIIPTKSPIAWALLAGITLVSASPTARKKVRQLAVKGTSALIGLSNKLKERKTEQENVYQFDFLNLDVENDAEKENEITNHPINQNESANEEPVEKLRVSPLDIEELEVEERSMQGEKQEIHHLMERKEDNDSHEDNGDEKYQR